MSRPNTGGPAFPISPNQNYTDDRMYGHPGMNLRDYFAAQVMTFVSQDEASKSLGYVERYLGLEAGTYKGEIHFPQLIAKRCYQYADAMLVERLKEKQ